MRKKRIIFDRKKVMEQIEKDPDIETGAGREIRSAHDVVRALEDAAKRQLPKKDTSTT